MTRLIVEKEGPVWIVKFHNPPHSFMDYQTAQELAEFLDEVEASSAVRVVILTGSEPGVFIRHYDVDELLQTGRGDGEERPAVFARPPGTRNGVASLPSKNRNDVDNLYRRRKWFGHGWWV